MKDILQGGQGDPFAKLGLPRAFALEFSTLQQAWQTLQQQFHPDRFADRSEAERLVAMQQSQEINRAYQTLKNSVTRAAELLREFGIEDISSYRHQLDDDFLEAIIATREAIAEALQAQEAMAKLMSLVNRTKEQQQELIEQLSQGFLQMAQDSQPELAKLALKLQFVEKNLRELREAESRLLDNE